MTRMVLSCIAAVMVTLPFLWSAFTTFEGTGRAIDGDSLMVGKREVRLWGVDAEEFDEPKGEAAFQALASIVDRQHVSCRRKQVWPSFQRIVAQCSTFTHSDVAWSLVFLGHVEDAPKFSGGYYRR